MLYRLSSSGFKSHNTATEEMVHKSHIRLSLHKSTNTKSLISAEYVLSRRATRFQANII